MTDFEFHGTGRTTGSSGIDPLKLLIGVVLISALAGVAQGIAEGVAAVVRALVIIAFAVIALAPLAVAAYFVFRRRLHPRIQRATSRLVRPPVIHQLAPEPERPAIAPREVHHHQHLHIAPGTDLSGLGDLFGKETITEGNQR